jgi:hypothetical protein
MDKIASDSQLNALRESMNNGIFRTDINNRMSGVISKEFLNGKMFESDNARAKVVDFAQVLPVNNNMEYPVIQQLPPGTLIEMQTGQYRITILKALKEDRWIYGGSLLFMIEVRNVFGFVLTEELSRFAIDVLRRNEKQFHVAETEADIWLQIQRIDQDLAQESDNIAKQQLNLHRSKLRSSLTQRTKSMLDFSDYVKKINPILEFHDFDMILTVQTLKYFSEVGQLK